MNTPPWRPGDAVWLEFLRRLKWPVTFSPHTGVLVIPGGRPMTARVTMAWTGRQLEANVAQFEADVGDWTGDLLLVGANPCPAVERYYSNDPAAGLIGERDGRRWRWSAACWALCAVCARAVVYSDLGANVGRPCGHRDLELLAGGAGVPAIGRTWGQASYAIAQRRSLHQKKRET